MSAGPWIVIPHGDLMLYHSVYMEPAIRRDDIKKAVAYAALKRLARNKLRRQSR